MEPRDDERSAETTPGPSPWEPAPHPDSPESEEEFEAALDQLPDEAWSGGRSGPDAADSARPWAAWVRHGRHVINDPEVDGRLDRYLHARFPYRSRTQWGQAVRSGRIRLNGHKCRPSHLVRTGDVIDYLIHRAQEPDVNFDIRTIFEDDHILVVDKPPDIPVHPSGRYFKNTVLSKLLADRGETLDNPGVRIVHRLDRETSGVLLFAKSPESARRLAPQFEKRTARKAYLALVYGTPAETSFTLDRPLGRNTDSKIRKSVGVVDDGEGWPALTEFEVAAAGAAHALLIARPRTGRLHQIRVHARAAGHPVVGDKMYGPDEDLYLKLVRGDAYSADDEARLLLDRQALHAWSLTVAHPESRETMTFRAPLPQDIRRLAGSLGIQPPREVLG